MQFTIRESGTDFTVIHAFANTEADTRPILEAAAAQAEPTLVFLITPSTIPISVEEADQLFGPFPTEHNGLR